MKITKEDLKSKYGLSLAPGLYEICIRDKNYKIDSIKDDTSGCVLVGLEKGEDRISNCKPTFDFIYHSIDQAMSRKEKVSILIINAPL